MLAVADVLDVLNCIWAQPMCLHDSQHLSVHQVMGPQAVEVRTFPTGEVFTDVESFTSRLVTNLLLTLSLVSFANLQNNNNKKQLLHLPHIHKGKLTRNFWSKQR